jgi:uncharacterized protein
MNDSMSRHARAAFLRALLCCCALLGATWAFAGEGSSEQLNQVFRRSALQIATPDARIHKFEMWIADDEPRRARGLMFVTKMADDQGMLFIYPQPQLVAMWMKNTHISLDMLFVSVDGRVERVVENTTPMSTKTIESGKPVLAVIELNAGTAQRFNIRAGAQVIHPAFSRTPGQ